MDSKKELDMDAYAYVSRIVAPIFNKVAQETSKNQLLVGKAGFRKKENALYQPHNFRLYLDFKKSNFQPKNQPLDVGFISHKVINSSEHVFFFEKFTIRVKKEQIQVQNKFEHKRWYVIPISHKAKEQVVEVIRKKDNECIEFLKEFIKHFGGSSNFKILNRHTEDKITLHSLDLLPLKMKFHNEVVKKVYNEPNVEFSNPVFACNYITNQAIKDYAPEIAAALHTINPLAALIQQTKEITDVFRNSHLVELLSPPQKIDFERWLFHKFGECP